MSRDDFSQATIESLAKRVGNRCSNPSCRKLTSGPQSDPAKSVNIGVAAHITAASEGGPRYDPSLSPEERRSITNGIWLCQDCAKLVDNDPERYLVELLQQWKDAAEEAAQAEIEGRASPSHTVKSELERICQTQDKILANQASQPEAIGTQIAGQFEALYQQISSLSTANISALLAPQHEASLKYARQLIEENKPAQALVYLESQKATVWPYASHGMKAQFLNCMGAANLRLVREREAAEIFFAAKQLDDQDEKILCNCAVGYLLLDNEAAAREAIQEVLDRNPKNMRAHSLLIHASTGRPFEEILESVLPDCRENHEVAFALGSAAQERRHPVEAVKWYRIALGAEKPPSPDAKASLATAILAALFQADTTLLHIGPPSTPQAEALREVVSLLNEALEQFHEPELRRTKFSYLVNRGVAKQVLGDKAGAAEDLDEALLYEPHLSMALFHRAIVADSLGQKDQAIDLLGRISDTSEVPFARLLRADYIMERDGPDAAIGETASFLETSPSEDLAHAAKRLLITAYLAKQDIAAARKLSEDVLEANPSDVADLVEAARVRRRQGLTDEANSFISQAMNSVTDETRPTHVGVLADALYELDRFAEAASFYERIVDVTANSPVTRRFLLSCYRAGKLERAIQITERLHSANGPLQFSTEVAAAIYEDIGDLPKARIACEQYLKVVPKDPLTRIRLAVVDLRSDNTDAIDGFLANPPNLNGLPVECKIQVANLLAVRGRNREAIKLLYEIRRSDPTGTVHLRYIHAFLFRGDDPQEWLEVTEVAVNVAVCVETAGRKVWYVIDDRPDADVDAGELPVTHPVAAELLGKRIGDSVVLKRGVLSSEEAKVVEIKSKYVHALHESAEALQTRFPDVQGFEAMHFPPGEAGAQAGLQRILDNVSRQHKGQEEVLKLYRDNRLTIGAVGCLLGGEILKAWSLLVNGKHPLLRCCVGSMEERQEAFAILAAPEQTLVIDPVGLITIHTLGVADAVVQVVGKLGVAQATVDMLHNELHRRKASGREGYFALDKEEAHFVRHEITKKDIDRHIGWLESLKEWVATNCNTLALPISLQIDRQRREKMEEGFGEESVDTMLIAAGERRVLYSDDLYLRCFAKGTFGVSGVWTQSILMKGLDDRIIDRATYEKAVLTLVQCGYKHTSIDSQILLETAKQANWLAGPPFTQVVRTLGGKDCDEDSAILVAIGFLHGLFTQPILRQSPRSLVFRLLDWLVTERQIGAVVGKVLAGVKGRILFSPYAEREIVTLLKLWWRIRFA